MRANAVACLNVDSATQGDRLSVGSVPSLRAFVYEAARSVADPKGRGTLYHSAYDSHTWMARVGDPEFAYHAAMARLWGMMALRLANAEVLPFDGARGGRDALGYGAGAA